MLKIIDMRSINDDTPNAFAIYNTVTDRFVEISGGQVWEGWEDFAASWVLADVNGEKNLPDRGRVKGLLPSWAQ